MVNVNKLKAKLVETGMNIDDLSKFTGLTKTKIYRRLKHPTEFTIEEADKMVNVLDLNQYEAISIFFTQYVS